MRKNPAIPRHTQRNRCRRRTKNQSRGLVHAPLGAVPLGIGKRHGTVRRCRITNLLRRHRLAERSTGIRLGDLVETVPARRDLVPVTAQRPAVRGPPSILDHGILLDRNDRSNLDLRPGNDLTGGAELLVGHEAFLIVARQFHTGPARQVIAVLGLPAAHHRDAMSTRTDRLERQIDQRLLGNAHVRSDRMGVRAHRLPDPTGRVWKLRKPASSADPIDLGAEAGYTTVFQGTSQSFGHQPCGVETSAWIDRAPAGSGRTDQHHSAGFAIHLERTLL